MVYTIGDPDNGTETGEVLTDKNGQFVIDVKTHKLTAKEQPVTLALGKVSGAVGMEVSHKFLCDRPVRTWSGQGLARTRRTSGR